MQYIAQIQEDYLCCVQLQPKALSMQIYIYVSAASIYPYTHHYKLRVEFFLRKN